MACRQSRLSEINHLTETQKRAFAIADNRLAELATWDKEALKYELSFLRDFEIDFDFSAIGFEAAEVDFMLEHDDAGAPTRKASSAIKGPAICHAGDVWCLGPHILQCGATNTDQADVIIRHWEAATGEEAQLLTTGERFAERQRGRRV